MTDPTVPSLPQLPPASKGAETKVKAATWASFLVSLAGLSVLETTATDLVNALPPGLNWLAPIAGAAILAASTYLAGYNTRTAANGKISASTRDAVRKWMEAQLRRRVGR